MRKKVWVGAFLLAAAFTVMPAAVALGKPSYTQPCNTCHSGPNITVTATLASTTGGTATYNVSATGANAIAVFDGNTKLATITSSSGQFSVAVGKTYTVYAVTGPKTTYGIGSTTVSPTAGTADTTPPTTTSDTKTSYTGTAVIHLTALDNVAVATTYYKLDGGAQTAGTSISVSVVGSHSLEFWSVDTAGNAETPHKTASFTIAASDTTAPTTTSDAKASYVGSGVIKLAATDNAGGSGVANTYHKLDGGTQATGLSISVSGAGSHTLEFWSVDVAGNIETPHKTTNFTITPPTAPDNTPPTTTSDAKASYAGSATIQLSAADNAGGSGVAHTYYKLDTAAQGEGLTVVVTALGSHSLEFWSVDASSNVEMPHKTAAFTVDAATPSDTTPPVTTSDAQASYVESATIHLTATDEAGGSGIAQTYYKLDGKAQKSGDTIVVTGIGSHDLEFWSVDTAGNSETHSNISLAITARPLPDTTPPTTTCAAAASYLSTAKIYLVPSDSGGSGVAHTYYKVDGGAQNEGTSVIVTDAGPHTLEFWSVDTAGNQETPTVIAFSVTVPAGPDNAPPHTASGAAASYVGTATINLTAIDPGSGVAHVYYILDGAAQAEGASVVVAAPGSHTLEFWSVDAAGNSEPHTTVTFSVKSTAGVAAASTITISSSASRSRFGRTFNLTGVLSPGSVGELMVVYVKKPGSARWSYSSARRTYAKASSGASWWYRYLPKARGTYRFYARFGGDATRRASLSRTILVAVR